MSRRERNPDEVIDQFWARVKRTSTCWLWTGGDNGTGYGTIRRGAERINAHRFSWELFNGPVPPGLCVLHHCDMKRCVRPDHLFLGTLADNNADKMAKGRWRGRSRTSRC